VDRAIKKRKIQKRNPEKEPYFVLIQLARACAFLERRENANGSRKRLFSPRDGTEEETGDGGDGGGKEEEEEGEGR
jgi:hypothetical protein